MSNSSDRTGSERVLKPKDPEVLLMAVKKILEDETVERVIIDRSKPYILVEKPAESDEEGLEKLLYETTRNHPIEEYMPSTLQMSPYQQLHEMYQAIYEEGLHASYVLAGSREQLANWLKIRIPRTKPLTLFGAPVLFNGLLPGDVFLVCGATSVNAYAGDVLFSIKGAYA